MESFCRAAEWLPVLFFLAADHSPSYERNAFIFKINRISDKSNAGRTGIMPL
jgi:hypothetical protein